MPALAPMGLVSALRETSVLFAALLSRTALRERVSLSRAVSCAIVALGAAANAMRGSASLRRRPLYRTRIRVPA
jgi:drug/metabolite transporter (DMT)-like permease